MEFKREIIIHKPVAEVWEVLGNHYGEAYKWASGLSLIKHQIMNIIKSIAVFAILIFGFGIHQIQAQKAEPAITVVKTVDLSADEVWKQLRIMDNIDELSSLVTKVKWTGNHGVGGQRVCTSADGQGYFKENIVAFSDNERTYSYAVVEGVPAKNMVNNFKVVDLGYQKSMIVWTTSFEFMENPQMNEEQFRGFLNQAVGEMIDNTVSLARKNS